MCVCVCVCVCVCTNVCAQLLLEFRLDKAAAATDRNTELYAQVYGVVVSKI